jgi:nucleoside-diphosphate-sugar epimerase
MAGETPTAEQSVGEGFTSEPIAEELPTPEPQGPHIVVGAGGPLGAAVIEALVADSKQVRAVLFGEPEVGLPEGTEAVVVNPLEPASIARGCSGASAIYDCFEPSYASWKKTYAEVTGNIVFAAIESGARTVFASHLLSSSADNERWEGEVLKAQGSGLTEAAVARLPQLFGVKVMNPMFKLIFDAVLEGKKAHWVGDLDVRRNYLDVEDAARAMILLNEDARAYGRAWNVTSPGGLSGRELIELAFKAVGAKPKVGRWSRGIALTGSLLAPDTKLVVEMPYDYSSGFNLDGSGFADAFPTFSFTPPDRTVEKALTWYKGEKASVR